MIRAVLVDDEAPARARLRALLAEVGGVHVIAECADAAEARAAIAADRPDLLFLDIEMPETRGTELAASLPEPRPFVVFCTAYDAFAIEAFQYDAVDYLLKPVTRQRLAATLERIRGRLTRQSDLERNSPTPPTSSTTCCRASCRRSAATISAPPRCRRAGWAAISTTCWCPRRRA